MLLLAAMRGLVIQVCPSLMIGCILSEGLSNCMSSGCCNGLKLKGRTAHVAKANGTTNPPSQKTGENAQ